MTTLTPDEILERTRARGITDYDLLAAADALQRKEATDAIPMQARASALRWSGAIALQIASDLGRHGSDIPSESVAERAKALPNGNLARYPLDLLAAAEEIVGLCEARNYGAAELQARWFNYACEALSNSDAPDPVPFREWSEAAPPDEVAELTRRQASDAEKIREANANPRVTRDFATLSRAQQVDIKRRYKPGETVHVGRDYVKVPDPDSLEALLGGEIVGADTELGPIEGL